MSMSKGMGTQPVEPRFWKFVDRTGDCWLWAGSLSPEGYGRMSVESRPTYAHRISYELHKGRIPSGLTIDHLCRNRRCVNPEHLEAVTERENILRGASPSAIATRTGACQRGHLFTDENTIRRSNGYRMCRACQDLRNHARYRPIYELADADGWPPGSDVEVWS